MLNINYILMILGCVLMFSQMNGTQAYAPYLTILGVVMMFVAISRISRKLPPKKDSDYNFTIIKRNNDEETTSKR